MADHAAADPSRHSYNKDNDSHVHAIDKLVQELGIPAEEVNRSYREVLDELKKDVNVTAFLPVLASIGVKERLSEPR
jgi:hypothetical protein